MLLSFDHIPPQSSSSWSLISWLFFPPTSVSLIPFFYAVVEFSANILSFLFYFFLINLVAEFGILWQFFPSITYWGKIPPISDFKFCLKIRIFL
jgi:hypothetical protein